jgi:LiaI-LiaF-like transmembrane region/Cell wall-active antibiotics response LiaF, C-terminal
MNDEQARSRIHIALGIGVIGFGVILLLAQTGIVSFERLYRFWPLILIAVGVAKLSLGGAFPLFLGGPVPMGRRREKLAAAGRKPMIASPGQDRLFGVVLIVVGVNLQLAMLGYEHFTWKFLWPLVVILAGVGIIYWSLEERKHPGVWADAEIDQANIFGGGEFRVTSQDFRGGRLMNICGGFKLDLTQANLQADEAVMDISALFGGGEIVVPREWTVSIRGTTFFGGYNDETRYTPREPGDRKKTLIVKGVWIFGGVNVKN